MSKKKTTKEIKVLPESDLQKASTLFGMLEESKTTDSPITHKRKVNAFTTELFNSDFCKDQSRSILLNKISSNQVLGLYDKAQFFCEELIEDCK